jgi:cellulose synthase/poly-beta-1,6-N-acetylglucosamine synthase-like glycosyltransferase
MRSQSSYFLYTLFHLFLPGLGQSYLGSWKKGLFFSTIFFCFFTSAYFLTQAQGLSEALPYLRIRCFPGGFLLFLNTVFLSLFPLVSTPETYQVQTYQLGQILLVILMIFNVMIWTEGLETLYWKKHPQASLALPEFPDRPFVFYMKKNIIGVQPNDCSGN